MDDSSRVLILMLLVVTAAAGLADAQINFSTSWGKRSIVPAPESDAIVQRQGDEDPTQAAARSTPPLVCQSLVNSLLTIRQLIATELFKAGKMLQQRVQQQHQAAADDVQIVDW